MAKPAAAWTRASAIALAIVVLIQFAIGFYLNSLYAPTAEQAHQSVQAIREDDVQGVLQNLHYWGSAWLIVHGFLHLALLVLTGAYLTVSRWSWFGSVITFGSAFAMQVTGNLLPFDRHDVQTAAIEGGVASQIPVLGEVSAKALHGGHEFGPATLVLWHKIHLWLLVPLALGAILCLVPPRAKDSKHSPAAKFFWMLPLLGLCILAFTLPAPHGTGATAQDYASFSAKPSWYTWGLHGALNTFEGISPGLGWIGSAVLPGMFGLLLVLAPWLGGKKDGLVRALFLFFVISFGTMAALNGGAPAPAWGVQDITEAKVADPGSGPPIDEKLAARGFQIAKKHCATCHGGDLKGKIGPNLTVTLPHRDPEWYKAFIVNPRRVKPGSSMTPQTYLTEEELAQVAEWLRKPK